MSAFARSGHSNSKNPGALTGSKRLIVLKNSVLNRAAFLFAICAQKSKAILKWALPVLSVVNPLVGVGVPTLGGV
jgi:hypothetical protein